MQHWSDKYINKPYIPREYTCGHLAVDVVREQFGFDTTLPADEYQHIRRSDDTVSELLHEFGVKTDQPQDGDAVIVRNQAGRWHIGIFFKHNGVAHVLHNLKSRGKVCRHRITDLQRFALSVEGYYRWVR